MLNNKTQRAVIAAFLLGCFLFLTGASVGTIDYISGVKNKSEVDVRSYVFQRTNGAGASASLGSTGSHTAVFTPCPNGINAQSVSGGASIRISGGTGTAENDVLTSFSASGANCTIGFTTINTHTGSFVFTSASNGLQEALVDAPANLKVHAPAGTYNIYAKVFVPSNIVIQCDGMFQTTFAGQFNNMVILDLPGTRNGVYDCGFTSPTQGAVGGAAIRLGFGTGNENTFTRIERIYCEPLYDCVVGVNASQFTVLSSVFYNFSHDAIIAADATNPDFDGPFISHNTMFNYNLGSAANACIEIFNTGQIMVDSNACAGSDANQLNYGLSLVALVSTGLNIVNNEFETVMTAGVNLTGTYNSCEVTGNNFLQPGSISGGFGLVVTDGSGSTGIYQCTATGNVFQGPGGSNTYRAIDFEGHATNWYVGGNTITLASIGIYANQSGTITFGPHNMTSVTTPMQIGNSSTFWDYTAPVTFAQLPSAANGSTLYVTNSNSTCSGTGSGRTCFREAGSWTH